MGDEWHDTDDEREDVSDLTPEFLALLDDLPHAARRGFIAFARESMAFDRARAARDYEPGTTEDPIAREVLSGAAMNELRHAERMLRFAVERRDAAVRAAHRAGYGWAELGRVLGVSRQALRQRYGP